MKHGWSQWNLVKRRTSLLVQWKELHFFFVEIYWQLLLRFIKPKRLSKESLAFLNFVSKIGISRRPSQQSKSELLRLVLTSLRQVSQSYLYWYSHMHRRNDIRTAQKQICYKLCSTKSRLEICWHKHQLWKHQTIFLIYSDSI